MKNINWDEIEEQKEYKRIVPGGYICKITSVEDVPEKEYLKIEYDIADGEFQGYYAELFESKNFWGGKFIRSYKESAQSFFKGFVTAIENSNKGFKFGQDESKLIGKLVGLVIGKEEYNKNDGTVGVRFICQPRSVDQIKKGDYEIPEFKKLKGSAAVTSSNNDLCPTCKKPIGKCECDDDLPF